jgi:hypothetical protein
MGQGTDPRPVSNGCWQWERPGPPNGGGFRVVNNPNAREHWWSCGASAPSAPDRPLSPGYWIYDDVRSDVPSSGNYDHWLQACSNAAANVPNPTASQRDATRGILITFDRPEARGAATPEVMSVSNMDHFVRSFGVDKFFFELYGSDLRVYDQAYYKAWFPARGRIGGELNIGDKSSTDAQVAAAVLKLCMATPAGHDLALFGGSGRKHPEVPIIGSRLSAVVNALDQCTA